MYQAKRLNHISLKCHNHFNSLTHSLTQLTHATDFLTGLLASVIAVNVFSFKSPPTTPPSYPQRYWTYVNRPS